MTGYTVTVYDVPVSVPRADATTQQASDGSFWTHLTSFPTSEAPRTPPRHLVVTIDTPGYLRATREVYAHPGTAVDLGVIDVVAAGDTNVVTIGPGGGSVTDSQGLITLIIPPGALATPTPITVTPIQNREEMPAPLPTITLTEYGFDLAQRHRARAAGDAVDHQLEDAPRLPPSRQAHTTQSTADRSTWRWPRGTGAPGPTPSSTSPCTT